MQKVLGIIEVVLSVGVTIYALFSNTKRQKTILVFTMRRKRGIFHQIILY